MDGCGGCRGGGCGPKVCIATKRDSLAKTYNNVCEFLLEYHDAKEIDTIHVGLGSCNELFEDDGNVFTNKKGSM